MVKKNKAVVWAVPSSETADARFHDVAWAADGNLNASHRRGHTKRFRSGYAGWLRAKRFARAKAKELGIEASIHPY